jgi:hypothetical protein
VELVAHGVVVLDNDTVGKYVLGLGGNESTREQDHVACGGCRDAKEEEDHEMIDDDTGNTGDLGYSDDDKIVVVVVEVDENDIWR